MLLGQVCATFAARLLGTLVARFSPRVPINRGRRTSSHVEKPKATLLMVKARTMARLAAEHGDDGTNDLLVSEIIHRNELQVWFVAEHVVDVPIVRV
jgi:hypothetical protein